jgi:putative ABC transport system permease protein
MPNVNLILLSAGFLQSLIITAIVLRSRARMVSGFWLVAFLTIITLQIMLKGLSKVWVMDNFPVFLSLVAYDLPLLFGPLALLYVRAAVGVEKFSLSQMLLFVPFLVEGAILLSFLAGMFSKAEYLLPNNTPRLIIHGVIQTSLLFYCVFLGFSVVKNLPGDGPESRSHLVWLKEFLTAVAITGFIIIVALKAMYYFYPALDEVRYLFLSLTGFVYWVSFKAMVAPAILNDKTERNSVRTLIHKARYFNSGLRQEQAIDIQKKLVAAMEEEKMFLQPGLNIGQVQQALGVSRHHLSQVLNTFIGKSFNDFVNEYRVQKACSLLADPAYDYLTIAGIAFESGFNSVSSFNLTFKKMTGMSPAQFKKTGVSHRRG